MKTCNKCGQLLDYTNFNKDSRSKDGYRSTCKKCRSLHMKQYYIDNKERINNTKKSSRLNNKEHHRKLDKLSYERNRDKKIASATNYYNENKDIIIKKRKQFRKDNPKRIKEQNRKADSKRNKTIERKAKRNNYYKRRKNIKQASSIYCDNSEINKIYVEAQKLTKSTGINYHVDHIIPLNHPDVCGLHVSNNMQVLTQSENCSKNNKFDGTYNNEGWRND